MAFILLFEGANVAIDNRLYLYRKADGPGDLLGFKVRLKHDYARDSDATYAIAVIGDCYPSTGIKPSVIEAESGLTCFNFATCQMLGVISAYSMVKRICDAPKPPPQYLIVGFIPDTLAQDGIDPNLFYELKQGNTDVLLPEFGWAQCLKFQVPSLKHQFFFRNCISIKIPSAENIEDARSQVAYDKGYMPWWTGAEYDGKVTDEFRTPFTVTPRAHAYLEKILALADEHEMRVIYLIPTNPPDWFEFHTRSGKTRAYYDYLETLKNAHPRLILLHPQRLLDRKELYADRLHTNGVGTATLSRFIGEVIRRLEAGEDYADLLLSDQ